MKKNQLSVCIYGLNYAPELTGVAKYTTEMAEWLAQRGHNVNVVSALPYYPKWHVFDGYNVWSYVKENINEVNITRCPLWVPRQPTFLKRVIHLLSYNITLIPVLLMNSFKKHDVIVSIQPPLLIAPLVFLASKIARSKKWMHVQDLEVNAAMELGQIKNKFLTSSLLFFERWIMFKFDVVSTISKSLSDIITNKGAGRVTNVPFIFPNWVDTNIIYPIENNNSMRNELNISDEDIVVLYSGSLGGKQGSNVFEYCANTLLSDKRIKFVLCMEGPQVNMLKEKLSTLKNIIWISLQPNEKLNMLLNLADIHFLPQIDGASRFAMPSKLTGMMASGRPIISTANYGTDLYTVVNKVGVSVECGDLNKLCDQIIYLANNENVRKELGKKGRDFAKAELSKEKILLNFEKKILELADV